MALTHNTDYYGQAVARLPGQYQGKPRMLAILQAFANEAQALEDANWDVYTQRLISNGPAQLVGRATFVKEDTATLFWPFPFEDTSYLMLPGKPVVTDGGGPVVARIDSTSVTPTSVSVQASALFTGYVPVLAWKVGENPIARGVGGDLLDKLGKLVGQPRNGMGDSDYLVLITARIAANRSDGRRESLIRLAKLLVPGASVYVKDFPPCSVLVFPQAPISVDPYVAAQFMEIAKAAGVYLMFGWTTSPLSMILAGGYSVANGTSIPTTEQSPGWFGSGTSPISGGVFAGVIGG